MRRNFQSLLLGVLVFATPIIWTPLTHELFEFPKMIFVYLTAILLAANMAWGGFREFPNLRGFCRFNLGGYSFAKLERYWPVVFYLTAILASFFLSIDKTTSFYGYYTRFNGGLLSVLSYLIIFISAIRIVGDSVVSTKSKGWILVKPMLAASAIISLYAIAQHFGIDANYWVQDVKLRVFSTLGQPNWLASYLLLLLPLTVHSLLSSHHRASSIVPLALFTLQFSAFWFTYSLSGIAGLLISGLVFLILNKALVRANLGKMAILATFAIVIVAAFPGPLGGRLREIKGVLGETRLNLPVLASTETVSTPQPTTPLPPIPPQTPSGGDTAKIRLLVWKGSLKLWLSSPKNFLFGTGEETFAFSFLPFRPKEMNYTSEWDFLYNKAHNEYLNLLATTGILGLLGFLGVIGMGIKKAKSPFEKALVAGLVGVSVSVFFGFHVVVTSLYSWVFLGILYTRQVKG